jgi:hypothetical protein
MISDYDTPDAVQARNPGVEARPPSVKVPISPNQLVGCIHRSAAERGWY